MPVRKAESGRHRSGPLPRSRAGQRALLLGRRRHSLPALAAKHLQGGRRRHRDARSRDGQPRPLGRAGRAAAQRRADGPRPRGGLARRTRLGDLHRRRGPRHRRTQTEHRLHALGQLRPTRPCIPRRCRSTAGSSAAVTSRRPTNTSALSAKSRSCGNPPPKKKHKNPGLACQDRDFLRTAGFAIPDRISAVCCATSGGGGGWPSP